MKNQLRRLKVLLNMFPEDAFYTISIKESSISLQGDYKSENVLLAQKCKFSNAGICGVNGYLQMQRGNIEIILT